jgi:hypothetical protein
MVIKPRAASLRTDSRCFAHDWHCDSVARPKVSRRLPLIGGRVIRLGKVNMPLPDPVAKWEWLPLGELHEARTFVSLSESAALHGVAARSVVVQRVFDSLAARR